MGTTARCPGDAPGRIRQCAWCRAIVDASGTYVPGAGVPLQSAVTHGICPDCKDALVQEVAEAPLLVSIG